MVHGACAGSALTTFNKGNVNLSPKIIAHRSSATRHEMLVNPPAYAQFCHKRHINDHVRPLYSPDLMLEVCVQSACRPPESACSASSHTRVLKCAWLRPLTAQTWRFGALSVCLSCSAVFACWHAQPPNRCLSCQGLPPNTYYKPGAGIVPAHAVHAGGRRRAERADLQRGVHEHPAPGALPTYCTPSRLPWVPMNRL